MSTNFVEATTLAAILILVATLVEFGLLDGILR
jgi:hypothetical protein